jgi:hypothetical protein
MPLTVNDERFFCLICGCLQIKSKLILEIQTTTNDLLQEAKVEVYIPSVTLDMILPRQSSPGTAPAPAPAPVPGLAQESSSLPDHQDEDEIQLGQPSPSLSFAIDETECQSHDVPKTSTNHHSTSTNTSILNSTERQSPRGMQLALLQLLKIPIHDQHLSCPVCDETHMFQPKTTNYGAFYASYLHLINHVFVECQHWKWHCATCDGYAFMGTFSQVSNITPELKARLEQHLDECPRGLICKAPGCIPLACIPQSEDTVQVHLHSLSRQDFQQHFQDVHCSFHNQMRKLSQWIPRLRHCSPWHFYTPERSKIVNLFLDFLNDSQADEYVSLHDIVIENGSSVHADVTQSSSENKNMMVLPRTLVTKATQTVSTTSTSTSISAAIESTSVAVEPAGIESTIKATTGTPNNLNNPNKRKKQKSSSIIQPSIGTSSSSNDILSAAIAAVAVSMKNSSGWNKTSTESPTLVSESCEIQSINQTIEEKADQVKDNTEPPHVSTTTKSTNLDHIKNKPRESKTQQNLSQSSNIRVTQPVSPCLSPMKRSRRQWKPTQYELQSMAPYAREKKSSASAESFIDENLLHHKKVRTHFKNHARTSTDKSTSSNDKALTTEPMVDM